MSQMAYPGGELELFEKARRWKRYWRELITPYVQGEVLEVGAGIGANTTVLAELDYRRWVCREPNSALTSKIVLPTLRHELAVGSIADLEPQRKFDSILYIDVLEHI